MRVALANVTSLRLHWHTVADRRADVVLITETRRTAVAQRVMRAEAGASGWQAFWGRPWSPVGGAFGMRREGGWGSWCARASQPDKYSPPRGHPAPSRTPWPRPCGTPPAGATSWLAWAWGRTPCTPRWRTAFRPSRPSIAPSGTTPRSRWRGTGRPRSWGEGTSTLT